MKPILYDDAHKDWTRYHIISTRGKWKFIKEGAKRAIRTADRQTVITEALYRVCQGGGYLVVHLKDGTVDFIIDNWCG
jgi:hypothetical protein